MTLEKPLYKIKWLLRSVLKCVIVNKSVKLVKEYKHVH